LSIESRPIVSSHGLEGSRRHTLLFGDLVHFSRGELRELVLGFLLLSASAKESAELKEDIQSPASHSPPHACRTLASLHVLPPRCYVSFKRR
jgi:hypothetical protein